MGVGMYKNRNECCIANAVPLFDFTYMHQVVAIAGSGHNSDNTTSQTSRLCSSQRTSLRL